MLQKKSVQIIRVGTIIFVVVCLVYMPALQNDFVNWDDPQCVYENINIRSVNLKSLYWMLTTFHMGNWHPLTWLSHALTYPLWGLNPQGHHLVNVIIHSFNTLLVFFLVIKLFSLWRALSKDCFPAEMAITNYSKDVIAGGVTAILFGVHPINVESVAWVTERKGLLSAFFVLLSLLSYLSYIASIRQKKWLFWYCISLLFFIFALMSKPMAITLPITLLLLDVYPLKRIKLDVIKTYKVRSVLLEKIPFLTFSIVVGIITIMAQHTGEAIRTLEEYPLDDRILNTLRSLVFYLEKMIIPVNLVPLYPFAVNIRWSEIQYLLSAVLVLIITGFCLRMKKQGIDLLLIAWSYYVITLLPTLSIIQIGGHAAADRFVYLPGLSIFLLIGIAVSMIWEKAGISKCNVMIKGLLIISIAAIIINYNQLTVQQIGKWRDSEILWKCVINAFPQGVDTAHNNLGHAYLKKGKLDDAVYEFKKVLAINPDDAKGYNNLGAAYTKQGRYDEAIIEYIKAIAIKQDFAKAYSNLAIVFYLKGYYALAVVNCDKAVALGDTVNPEFLKLLKPYY